MLVFSLFLSVFWCVFSFRVGGGGGYYYFKKNNQTKTLYPNRSQTVNNRMKL